MKRIMKRRKILLVLPLVWFFLGSFFAAAHAAEETWWNKDWQYRKKLSFDTTPAGADIKSNLTDVQILQRLHSGNLNFANTKETGEDIRFVSADDKTLLHHHIEYFDGADEIALVWVKIPRVSGGADTDFIWMYYGNGEAVGGQDSRATFGNMGVVYHFPEIEPPPRDAGANGLDITEFSGGMGMPAVIGKGLSMNGMSDSFNIPAAGTLDMTGGFTFSAWINMPAPLENAVLFERGDVSGKVTVGIDQTRLYCTVTDKRGNKYQTEKTADLTPGTWHSVSVTGTPEGIVSVYVEGIRIDWTNLNRRLPGFSGNISVAKALSETNFYTGELDEVRVYPVAVPADRIRLDFLNQGPEQKFITAGTEEVNSGGGLPIFYLATIFRNISLDGWLVIISLLVLGMMSWGVILTKGLQLQWMKKENETFKDIRKGNRGSLTEFRGVADEFQNSSLYRIFITGKEALLRHKTEDETEMSLGSKDIDFVKSELEKGLIEETRKLNSWLTILTMAISGGPFLGLLGTVWGVMNTFAAMAEAGEANIMAIAPGVASALATTVFGLIVAIPALFGYNYLSTRIRQFTIDLSIFVDDFGLETDRKYGGTK